MRLKYDVHIPNYVNKSMAPIVLLHSMIETRKTWLYIAPEIMKLTGRKVYAIDARNHGESPWTDEYSIDAMANDLEEFLLQNRINKVVLVGHSIGGKVAIEFAFRKPQSVEKLIIEDSTPRNFIAGGGRSITLGLNLLKDLNSARPEMDKEGTFNFIKSIFLQFSNLLGGTNETLLNYDIDLLPFEWKGNTLSVQLNLDVLADAMINNKLQQRLSGTFEGDVLLLYGKRSLFKIGTDLEFLKYLPRTTKIEFENAGHFIHQVHPKEFTQEVANFINKGSVIQARY